MSDFLLSHGIASYISQEVLIVPFQADFYPEVIEALRQDILLQLHQRPEIKGLIIDLSKVKLMDLENMQALEQTLNMAAVFGVKGFLVGIQPSVTLVLVDLGYEPGQLNTALTIERGILLIHQACKRIASKEQETFLAFEDEPTIEVSNPQEEMESDNGG